MIHAEHITKRFGRHMAVNDVSFDVAAGEAVALWGPNGAGKTTAIRCVLGLLAFEGKIEVNRNDIRKRGKAARRSLGYVPQELALHDDLRTLEALHFYGRLKRAPRDRPRKVLADVGLAQHGRKRVGELSGGMKQRLALAIALLSDPPLLVLDELTASLDASGRTGFIDLLVQLKRVGKSMLFTSHRLEEVESLADRVLVLRDGTLQCESTGAKLADTLGLRSVLKVYVETSMITEAALQLQSAGFIARPNGTSVHVEVEARRKAMPIHALKEASINVCDFEVINDHMRLHTAADDCAQESLHE